MAEAVENGLETLHGVLYSDDCQQCALSTHQQASHDVSFESASKNLPGYRHAVHAMIYATDDRVLFGCYKMCADIMVGHMLYLQTNCCNVSQTCQPLRFWRNFCNVSTLNIND